MVVQWIALSVTVLLAIVSIATGVYQSSQAQKAAMASEKTRADLASMKLEVVERIDQRLSDFVRQQTMKDYIEGHAKEHRTLEQELTRLRDWKEDMDGVMRKNTDELKRVLKEIKGT